MPGPQLQVQSVQVPHYFRCPISLELMRDPVTVATGQTYDRASIEKWVADGNNTCPATMQRLQDTTLIPNHTLRRLIQDWCSANAARGIDRIPTPKQPADPRRIHSLLASTQNQQQRLQALRALRSLARENEKNRGLIADARGAEALLSALFSEEDEVGDEIREAALAVLVMLPLSPGERRGVTRSCRRRQLLARLVQRGASSEARINAAVLIEKLASSSSPAPSSPSSPTRHSDFEEGEVSDEPSSSSSSSSGGEDESSESTCESSDEESRGRERMRMGGTPGLLGGLVDLVSSGGRGGRAGVKALFAVCLESSGSSEAAVAAGACGALVEHLAGAGEKQQQRGDAERTLATLELVCRGVAGRAAVARHALAVPALVAALVWRRWSQASECAAGALLAVCSGGGEEVQRGAVEAGVLRQLLLLIQSDCTDRAKRKGVELLKLLRRWWADDPCLSDLERTDFIAF